MFSLAFDGPSKKEIIRLNDNYGNYDKEKTLIKKLRANELSKLKSSYYMSFEVDKDKLFILVYDINKKLIEKYSYVYLESIKKHLLTKLNNLAYIKASKKKINDKEHFRFYEINLFKLKDFDTFVNLLINGKIEISLISRINKSGINAGRHYNKNLVFQIKKKNLEKLFKLIYYYNCDLKLSYNFQENYKDEIQIL